MTTTWEAGTATLPVTAKLIILPPTATQGALQIQLHPPHGNNQKKTCFETTVSLPPRTQGRFRIFPPIHPPKPYIHQASYQCLCRLTDRDRSLHLHLKSFSMPVEGPTSGSFQLTKFLAAHPKKIMVRIRRSKMQVCGFSLRRAPGDPPTHPPKINTIHFFVHSL